MNKRGIKRLFPVFMMLTFLVPASLNAHDFGLILNQTLGATRAGGDSAADYEAALVPRVSFLLGDYGDLFLSASLKVVYENQEWNLVPELLRNEFSWRFDNLDLNLGRMMYTDPMSLIAAGLFDGVRVSYHSSIGTFGAGLWYTGLLYRNRANIAMTAEDAASLGQSLDWGNFSNTYFASRRLMTAVYWDHLSFAELLHLSAAFIAQADMNGRDNAFHSQYLTAKAVMPFQNFIFELGGALGFAQAVNDGTDFYTALAGDIGVHWGPPAPFYNMLSFTGRFTSGASESGGSRAAFTPITALSYGDILNAKIPGLSILSLRYTARPLHTFSAAFTISYFIRSDTETFTAYPLDGQPSNNQLLGAELFTRFIWSPVSDISLNLGAGAFLPSLGNAAPNANSRWLLEASAAMALR